MNDGVPVVYLVDDDPSVLKAISRLLGAAGLQTKSFTSPRTFLNEHDLSEPGCIVLDVGMPELSGLDLQERLALTNKGRPIVFTRAWAIGPTVAMLLKPVCLPKCPNPAAGLL